jgi:hypothetical protein
MAAKRGNLDAVFQLPGVAGRYSQEIDLKEDRGELAPPTPTKETPQPPVKEETAKQPAETPKTKPEEKPIIFKDKETGATVKAEGKGIEGFMPASDLPVTPPDFKLSEEAAYVADYIRENFDQPADAVRAMIYAEMAKAAGLLTDVAAAKLVQSRFEESSKPAEEPKDLDIIRDEVSDALNAANLDGSMIEVQDDGSLMTKMRADGKRVFLGDIWGKYSSILEGLGYHWVRDGAKSHWERDKGV